MQIGIRHACTSTPSPAPLTHRTFSSLFWEACRTLVPQSGIEPTPPAVEVQSLNHWLAREVPSPKSFSWPTSPPRSYPWLCHLLPPSSCTPQTCRAYLCLRAFAPTVPSFSDITGLAFQVCLGFNREVLSDHAVSNPLPPHPLSLF